MTDCYSPIIGYDKTGALIGEMARDEDGEYVTFADYDSLRAELSRLNSEREHYRNEAQELRADLEQVKAELEFVKAERRFWEADDDFTDASGTELVDHTAPENTPWTNNAAAEIAALRARCERLEAAINWALGANGHFSTRQNGDGPYWWRNELRERAGLEWDGEKYVDRSALDGEEEG